MKKISERASSSVDGHEEEEERDDDELQLSGKSFWHGYHLVEGKQGHEMEDYVVAQIRLAHGNQLGLFAIFDGHSGQHVADWLRSHLFDSNLDEYDQPDFWTKPESAIKRAYKETDNEILDEVVGARRGGSTAVTAILINGEKLIVANEGDSRAIICRNGVAEQLSVVHEPEKERDMVESKGGLVSHKPGNVSRVDGQLAMTRAFGDQSLKQQITSKSDVTTGMIDQETEFIILGRDGLWKVMSNQEAADSMRGIDDPQAASEHLIQEALSRKSTDDISCIVVSFY